MPSDPSLIVAPRPEQEFAGRWGIYSVDKGRWMEVIFASEHEASESLQVLKTPKPTSSSSRLVRR